MQLCDGSTAVQQCMTKGADDSAVRVLMYRYNEDLDGVVLSYSKERILSTQAGQIHHATLCIGAALRISAAPDEVQVSSPSSHYAAGQDPSILPVLPCGCCGVGVLVPAGARRIN